MSFPPALTWLELLPKQTCCACESGPGWLRALVAEHVPRRRDANECDALALVNSSDVPAGYEYVRHLGVLPNLDNPRWFVPLDSGARAAAGLSLYTPARTSAHLKKLAVKLAARSGLKFWCRDRVTVACRTMPPLERKIRELFAGADIRLALSAGAPEPARNRKASAAVIDPKGNVLAFVKIAGSEISREIAAHEAAVLPLLPPRLGGRVPELLFAGDIDSRFMTVQTPLAGKPAAAKFTPAHARFLESLRGEPKIAAETNLVAALPNRIAALPEKCELDAHLEAILPTLETMKVPSTIIHGDFAPWNLRTHGGEIAAFDWEYAQLDGLPLFDQTHYQLQVGYLLHAWSPQQALRCLEDVANSSPMSLTPAQVRALQAVYFIDNLARLLGEGYPADDEMLAWYRQVLRKLAPVSTRKETALV